MLPAILKQLRAFNQFIPNIAAIGYPLRSVSKKDADWIWNKDHETANVRINEKFEKVVELSHFERNRKNR